MPLIRYPLYTPSHFADRQARNRGAEEALVDLKRRLSWAEVKALSDRLALGLMDLGLARNDPLFVQLPNSVELYLVRLAAEKAGVKLVAAPTTFRRAEVEPILHHTRPVAAIASPDFRGFNFFGLVREIQPRLPSLKHLLPSPWELLTPADQVSLREQELRQRRFRARESCHIATSSGSTGPPKCMEVAIGSRTLTGRVQIRRFGITSKDVILAPTPIITGVSDALAYCGAPQIGARVVLLEHFTPEAACSLIEKEGVTVMPVVPTILARLLAYPKLDSHDLGSLKLLINHASSLPYRLGVEAEERLGCTLVQACGAMDYGGISATYRHDPREVRLGTVGRPLDGNEVLLVDAEGRPVPPGEVGRILIRGLHAVGGYYRNPELTREAWRTGYYDLEELGRWDPQGNLVLVGRQKDVIKRGGQTLFARDIEDLLAQHPKVAEVAVIGMPDPVMGERVCAYVVPRSGEGLTLEEGVAFLRERGLAPFKLPERIEVVESLPYVPAGHKVDKRRLVEDITAKLMREGRALR